MVSEYLFFQGIAGRPAPPTVAVARPRPPRGPVVADGGEGEFFSWLFGRADLPSAAYRAGALRRRLPACLRFLRAGNLHEARGKLESQPALVAPILSIVLLGVTEFCRDQPVFDQLQRAVLPELARRPGGRLRVWSAGCSDGRELASVAILLREAGLLSGAELLGTDCRAEAIGSARRAEFPHEAIRSLEEGWKDHFLQQGARVRLCGPVHERLRWKQADLLAAAEPGPWDLVLWRNMAIYLEPPVAERLWNAILAEVAPGGFVVSGKADYPPRPADLEKIGPCIYRKKEETAS